MAILTAAANPAHRGTFMTLNAAVQSAAMGCAAFIGGHIISRDSAGLVTHYWGNAVVGITASVLSMMVVGSLFLHGSQHSVPPTPPKP
jgi:predicted MFS family arabinose efflux permease